MLYFLKNLGSQAFKDFIEDEIDAYRLQDMEFPNKFLISVNRSVIPRKFCVELIYIDKLDGNILQLTSINLHSREKAYEFAKGIQKTNPFVKPLNF